MSLSISGWYTKVAVDFWNKLSNTQQTVYCDAFEKGVAVREDEEEGWCGGPCKGSWPPG